jgi:hypothetical protein
MAYLKELLGWDVDISPDSISIEKIDKSNAVKIRIKTHERQIIKNIASNRDLCVLEEGERIVIYEP